MRKNIAIILVAILLGTIANWYFWTHYYFQSPIKTLEWQCLLCKGQIVPFPTKTTLETPKTAKIEQPKPTTKPLTDKYIWNERIEKLYQVIRTMESGKGTNPTPGALHNKCADKDMRNQIGYLATPDYCFDNEEHEKLTFSRWIIKREKMTDNQLLCLWNTGTIVNSCSYSIYAEQII